MELTKPETIKRLDLYETFLSKLSSAREEDRDDLRALVPQLDKDILVGRLQKRTANWQAAPELLKHARTNWYILYGEALPT
jgi:hypothetical protein